MWSNHFNVQGCRKRRAGGALAPQFVAEQLTLSQPGGQIMPTIVLQAPPPGFSDLATALNVLIRLEWHHFF